MPMKNEIVCAIHQVEMMRDALAEQAACQSDIAKTLMEQE
jgi:hypothetical protein